MQILTDTFTALSPLYFFMLTGALLRKTGIITESLTPALNRILFHSFLPISLFLSVYQTDLSGLDGIKTILFPVGSYVVMFVALMLLVPRFIPEKPAAATVVQGLYRSNFVLLGLAYATQLFGAENIGPASILVAIIVPLFNVLAVLDFELMRGGRPKPLEIIVKILKNPLIIATLLALALRLLHITLPKLVFNPLNTLGSVATPFALVIIGSSLTLSGFRKNSKRVIGVTIGRLIVIPCIFMPLTVLFGIRDVALIAMLTAFAGPAAASSSAMAYQLGGDGELASQIVATTTVLSLPTMYLFIVALRALGLC